MRLPFNPFNSKLSLQILTRIILISGAITLVNIFIQVYVDYKTEEKSIYKEVDDVMNAYKSTLSSLFFQFDSTGVQESLDGMTLFDSISYVQIRSERELMSDNKGIVINEKLTPENKNIYGINVSSGNISSDNTVLEYSSGFFRSSFINELRIFERTLFENIDNSGKKIKLIAFANMDMVEKRVLNNLHIIIITQSVKTFLVSFFILLFISQMVIRHIEQIVHWLKSFKPEYSFNPIALYDDKKNNNEIDELKIAISGMGKLVHEHTTSLENIVVQRTKELKSRTVELEKTQLELQKLLREKEQKLDNVTESITDWLWDLDQFGNVISMSEELLNILGIKLITNKPQQLTTLLPFNEDETNNQFLSLFKHVFVIKAPMDAIDCNLKTNQGSLLWLTLTAQPYFSESGGFLGYHGTAKDLTEHKYLEKLAYTDGLTGVANRVSFFQKADDELKRSRRLSYDIGVMMLDLDNFKLINDNYGHDAGDDVLKIVSNAMSSCLRKEDILGRLGGEEFAIIVPGADKIGMYKLSSRLQQSIELKDFSFLEQGKKITVSIGYTKVSNDESFKSSLKRADKHLYVAKTSGRNCFVTDKEFVFKIVN
jgi:diguanylate cyclase (GGDEF)-like protein/PAS domain S-box-containing protein